MSEKITISDISISGFRAFLEPQSFSLRSKNRPLSLAIFAPNVRGKSSFVDALEFFFSSDGTLKRLGIKKSGTQAGREALEHVKAQEAGIDPKITIKFATQSGVIEGTRTIKQCEVCPDAAVKVISTRKLDFLIRGYELRYFVENQTPLDRYLEVSSWFGLSSLASIERNLRQLRLRLKDDLDKNPQAESHIRDLRRVTGQGLSIWNEGQVLSWFNRTCLEPLDPSLALDVLGKQSLIYKTIIERKKQEDESVGLAALNELYSKVQSVYFRQEVNDSKSEEGAVINFDSAALAIIEAKSLEQDELAKSTTAIFREVWEAASKVFKEAVDIVACPVCDTPLQKTSKGSRESIAIHIDAQLVSLERYSNALNSLRSAKTAALQKQGLAITALETLKVALRAGGFASDAEVIDPYVNAVQCWKPELEPPESISFRSLMVKILERVNKDRQRIEEQQGEKTYGNCLGKLDELIKLKLDVDRNNRIRAQLQVLLDSLMQLEMAVGSRIRGYIQKIIDTLKNNVNVLYRAVHADEKEAPTIILDLATETKQPQLNLLTNFAPNRQGVVPSGYFSDSQVHTLALSLWLAAILVLNTEVPIAILDDVVTSYDADHRKAIAAMLATHFANYQVILVTHDERFFTYLKDHLPASSWIFKRIKTLDKNYGPIFHDHMIADEEIEEKLSKGKSVANDIRQAEEEWLLGICRDFHVEVEIRDIHKPYSYERSELAVALYKFLRDKKISAPNVSGVSNPFLLSLQRGEVENFGSHFSDDPSAWASPGDEKRRWQEFKYFRDLFTCPECGCTRFKRPKGMDKPVCRKCEKSFNF